MGKSITSRYDNDQYNIWVSESNQYLLIYYTKYTLQHGKSSKKKIKEIVQCQNYEEKIADN